jgi:adenylylsulfate reductase subunit A
MAACGTAFEVKKWLKDDQTVLLCDKAAMERSGAVAQGLSAINTYIGENAPEDYVRMVRNDLMGLVREDLIFDLGCTSTIPFICSKSGACPSGKKPKTERTWTVKRVRKWGP